jgi:serine/threonine-protein kinase
MELLRGETLEARLTREGRLTPRDLAPLLTAICEGLAAVHAHGVIHGDLKPSNVFLVSSDDPSAAGVKIVDFGLSKVEGLERLTRTGELTGTPVYMAPELVRDGRPSPASDQFALCVAIWEALTGAPPFAGPTPGALAVTMMTPPDAKGPLLQVVARGLSPDPLSRWADLDALRAALARPPSSSRTLVVALGLALLAIAATIGILARL